MRLEYAAGSNLNGKEQFQNYSLLTIKRIHTCEKQKSIKEKKTCCLLIIIIIMQIIDVQTLGKLHFKLH